MPDDPCLRNFRCIRFDIGHFTQGFEYCIFLYRPKIRGRILFKNIGVVSVQYLHFTNITVFLCRVIRFTDSFMITLPVI